KPSLMQYVRAGKLRALAVAGSERNPDLPDLPTIAESANLPGYEMVAWQGIVAPAKTPLAIIDKLNQAFNLVQQQPEIKERLESMGYTVVGGTPEEFAKYMSSEIEKWKIVARENNISNE